MISRKTVLSIFVTTYVLMTCPMEQDSKKVDSDSLTETNASNPALQDPNLAAASVALNAPAQAVKSQKRKNAVLQGRLASQQKAKKLFVNLAKQRLVTINSLNTENENLRAQINQLETKNRALEHERGASIPFKLLSYVSSWTNKP